MREIHVVIFHRPGPRWDHALPMLEQPGLQDHVDHYRSLGERGLMRLGGPFMDASSGGMMVAKPALTMDEARAYALADPCVKSGLLVAELRPWLLAMDD